MKMSKFLMGGALVLALLGLSVFAGCKNESDSDFVMKAPTEQEKPKEEEEGQKEQEKKEEEQKEQGKDDEGGEGEGGEGEGGGGGGGEGEGGGGEEEELTASVVYSACMGEGIIYDIQSLDAEDKATFLEAVEDEIDGSILLDMSPSGELLDAQSVFAFIWGSSARDDFEQKLKDAGLTVERTVWVMYKDDGNPITGLNFEREYVIDGRSYSESEAFDDDTVITNPKRASIIQNPTKALVEACQKFFLKAGLPVGDVQEDETDGDDVLFVVPIINADSDPQFPRELTGFSAFKKIAVFAMPFDGKKYTVMYSRVLFG